jgi:hypothetical protein
LLDSLHFDNGENSLLGSVVGQLDDSALKEIVTVELPEQKMRVRYIDVRNFEVDVVASQIHKLSGSSLQTVS